MKALGTENLTNQQKANIIEFLLIPFLKKGFKKHEPGILINKKQQIQFIVRVRHHMADLGNILSV